MVQESHETQHSHTKAQIGRQQATPDGRVCRFERWVGQLGAHLRGQVQSGGRRPFCSRQCPLQLLLGLLLLRGLLLVQVAQTARQAEQQLQQSVQQTLFQKTLCHPTRSANQCLIRAKRRALLHLASHFVSACSIAQQKSAPACSAGAAEADFCKDSGEDAATEWS